MTVNAGETPIVRNCGTDQVHARLLATVPAYAAARAELENIYWSALQAAAAGEPVPLGRDGVTTIPVVVFVVGNAGGAGDVTDAQVAAQIDVLNNDYRMKNPDQETVPEVFKPLTADSHVQFEPATTDPSGAATTGIVRVASDVESFGTDDAVKSSATGGADAWPADRYLNLWVCRLEGGLLGYAQFPGGPAETDGVVITHTAFGTGGTAQAPFDLGRTATHEIGHWLNLRHIWGDDGTGCSGSDFVTDTPNCAGPNTGSPSFPHVTCGNGPNGDLFMNYMDYTDDAAMTMFTAGQVFRMQAALGSARPTIGTTPAVA
jgi:pregnancy-associated plasma protein-A